MSPAPTQPSATPRTLEAAGYPNNDWHSTADRLFIEAQKLETELAEAREDAKITSLIVGKAHSDIIGLNAELARLRAELSATKKDLSIAHDGLDERDRLRAENETFKSQIDALAPERAREFRECMAAMKRAERAEAELADLAKRYNAQK